jgi:hypothetical protein
MPAMATAAYFALRDFRTRTFGVWGVGKVVTVFMVVIPSRGVVNAQRGVDARRHGLLLAFIE